MSGSLELVDCCSNPWGLREWPEICNLLCQYWDIFENKKRNTKLSQTWSSWPAEPKRCCLKIWIFCKLLFGARHLTSRKRNFLFQFSQSYLGRPVFCVGDAIQMWVKMDKIFVACNILNLVPSCSSLLSRVQVSSSSEEEDWEAGDQLFSHLRECLQPVYCWGCAVVQSIACCFICRNENSVYGLKPYLTSDTTVPLDSGALNVENLFIIYSAWKRIHWRCFSLHNFTVVTEFIYASSQFFW